ncbi:cytidylate kinase [Moesziomyces antarcticus]|uniref:Related to URA6 - uridine-monophosphate kinase n=2 Tax=Pseudozyma antarctica TaxID=84753 RepID=A0A5C3FUN8_PSEA2|nr:cytidylate kinase [Moesziomyces antarcticus]GAK68366.1 cytidylate kinase [Moesziomyces antarcticus]SPO47291.1 related to URA6 - uridine-monophosphate kinase [Moesziomyces antarcticus]
MLSSSSSILRRLSRTDRLASPIALRAYSTSGARPKKNHPSPIGFALIAIAAFGTFAYVSRSRHDDPQKHLREKRIPHPNPLIPPRSQEPQVASLLHTSPNINWSNTLLGRMGLFDKLKHKKDDQATASAGASGSAPAAPEAAPAPAIAEAIAKDTPRFDSSKVTVVFVLGGPGAGKGTQCARLVEDYGFVHLSAGDLLRAEQQREGSQYGAMIAEYIKEGKIVPMEVTVALLSNAIADALAKQGGEGKGRFLVDGFPRKMDQAIKFDESVCPSQFVLFLQCSEEVMLSRLLERGKTSGRTDDNIESIKKRFQTFVETSMPVVDYYRKQDRVVEVDSIKPVDEVYAEIKQAMDRTFANHAQQ